jgi:ABC-type glycerol-3-phosphate transport system substrate-binding protein
MMLILPLFTACLLMAAVPFSPAHAQEMTEIVFTSGPDGSGTVQRMIDAFNDLHRGEIQVRWRQMSPENDAHHQELIDDLASDAGGIDLMASDVVWTAELAKNHWVEDLSGPGFWNRTLPQFHLPFAADNEGALHRAHDFPSRPTKVSPFSSPACTRGIFCLPVQG